MTLLKNGHIISEARNKTNGSEKVNNSRINSLRKEITFPT
jgi:hypothetical protein